MPAIRSENTSYIGKEFLPTGANTGSIRRMPFVNPVAPNTTGIHAAITTAALITTALTNPDFPRVTRIVSGGASHNATGNVVFKGTDYRDQAITDTIALNGNTSVDGTKAFKTYTSIDTTGVSGIGAAATVACGFGAALGLDRLCDSDGVLKCTVDGAADSALPTVASDPAVISKNTVVFATATNGVHDYVVTFVTNEVYAPN